MAYPPPTGIMPPIPYLGPIRHHPNPIMSIQPLPTPYLGAMLPHHRVCPKSNGDRKDRERNVVGRKGSSMFFRQMENSAGSAGSAGEKEGACACGGDSDGRAEKGAAGTNAGAGAGAGTNTKDMNKNKNGNDEGFLFVAVDGSMLLDIGNLSLRLRMKGEEEGGRGVGIEMEIGMKMMDDIPVFWLSEPASMGEKKKEK